MKLSIVNKLPFGAYRVFWKDGNYSIGVIGQEYDGRRWLACSNWTNGKVGLPVQSSRIWRSVKYVKLIERN